MVKNEPRFQIASIDKSLCLIIPTASRGIHFKGQYLRVLQQILRCQLINKIFQTPTLIQVTKAT